MLTRRLLGVPHQGGPHASSQRILSQFGQIFLGVIGIRSGLARSRDIWPSSSFWLNHCPLFAPKYSGVLRGFASMARARRKNNSASANLARAREATPCCSGEHRSRGCASPMLRVFARAFSHFIASANPETTSATLTSLLN